RKQYQLSYRFYISREVVQRHVGRTTRRGKRRKTSHRRADGRRRLRQPFASARDQAGDALAAQIIGVAKAPIIRRGLESPGCFGSVPRNRDRIRSQTADRSRSRRSLRESPLSVPPVCRETLPCARSMRRDSRYSERLRASTI